MLEPRGEDVEVDTPQSSLIPAGPGEFFASVQGSVEAINQPDFAYVGFVDFNTQQIIAAPVLEFDNDDVGFRAGFEAGYVFQEPLVGERSWVALSLSYAEVDGDDSVGQVQANNGDAEFLGPAGGGFTLLRGPTGVSLNDVEFHNDYSEINLSLRGYNDFDAGGVTVTPFVGIDYRHMETDSDLSLTAIGKLTVDVTRSDAINTDQIGLTAGIYASRSLSPRITLFGGGHGTLAHSDADGKSTLTRDIGNGPVPESAQVSGRQTTLEAGASIGARIDLGDKSAPVWKAATPSAPVGRISSTPANPVRTPTSTSTTTTAGRSVPT